jgi:hypothetical protein
MNKADDLLLTLQSRIADAEQRIVESITTILVRSGCVDLYPEGADKQKAEDDAEEAKQQLVRRIAVYDELRYAYTKTVASYPRAERDITAEWDVDRFRDSHAVVERAYRLFHNIS